MIDAVLSIHTNPMGCGVAKFNQILADKLGVPHASVESMIYRHPLVSIKTAESKHWWDCCPLWTDYQLFLHDVPQPMAPYQLRKATKLYAANKVIADAVRPIRPDVIQAWCPSTVQGNPDRGGYRVLTFGMAHKLVIPHFQKLKEHLEKEHPDYTISMSTAVHEGYPWETALRESSEALRGVFGSSRLRVLGYLSDDALAREISECDAVAAYFPAGFRENNTSAWAALAAGKKLYTNYDADSPNPVSEYYSWDRLLRLVHAA